MGGYRNLSGLSKTVHARSNCSCSGGGGEGNTQKKIKTLIFKQVLDVYIHVNPQILTVFCSCSTLSVDSHSQHIV